MQSSATAPLVIGISSRALFDLTAEDALFREQGLEAYERIQLEREEAILAPGSAFPLVRALLNLNTHQSGRRLTEVVVMSRNAAETSLRIFRSIEHHGLDISRVALTGGAPLAPYLGAFGITLFLSLDESDVQAAVDSGCAAAHLYDRPQNPLEQIDQIRIAFDGDAVLFSDEAERVYQSDGLQGFIEHERLNAKRPLPEGPFAPFLKALSTIQAEWPGEEKPIRTALVTARSLPAHERVILTLRVWGIDVNEAFFLGGTPKSPVLEAFKPHMFFDDQCGHCEPASKVVATGRVPYRRN